MYGSITRNNKDMYWVPALKWLVEKDTTQMRMDGRYVVRMVLRIRRPNTRLTDESNALITT